MPPRRPASPFPFRSGNFDFPHASTSPPPAARNAETYDSHPRLNARRELERESAMADNPRPPSRSGRSDVNLARVLRPSIGRRATPPYATATAPANAPTSASPSSPNGRLLAMPSERYLRRSYARWRQQRTTNADPPADMLDSLTDFPVTNPFALGNTNTRPRSSTGENDNARRQTKRRKIEHESVLLQPYDGFKYGHRGQVVPGRLKMEVMSCDGGEYNQSTAYGLYPIQNVLKNDKSVYCSERSRCNLLLKHIAEMPFSLEKVVIRAPDRGFTAPVQEGLIFVSMSSEELIQSTSAYELEYETSSSHRSPTPEFVAEQELSIREAIADPYVWENSRQGRLQAMEEQVERMRLRGRLQTELNTLRHRERRRATQNATIEDDVAIENSDELDEPSHPTARVSAPTPPPFTITTESDEGESDDYEDVPSAAIMADRLRRESRWRAYSEDEEDDLSRPPRRMDSFATYDEYRRWRTERHLDPIRGATRLRTPSRIEAKDECRDVQGLVKPHARFFIAKHKNKITIKFHPAVSGKFVLLKLWSPTHDGNIDIESVQFYGYSGPRFFPAVQLA